MPIQRFRLTYARGPDAPPLNQRDQQAAWADALQAAGLSGMGGDEAARLTPAAPIPIGLTGDAELADLFLPVRRTAADLRALLVAAMPTGHRLVDLHDVWLGEPALPAVVVGADYRVTVAVDDRPVDQAALAAGVAALLATTTIARPRGGNLRPLIEDVRVRSGGVLAMQLRIDPSAGSGRPEEVVAALATLTGLPLELVARHRERLRLRGD
jgi:hypothetical protein